MKDCYPTYFHEFRCIAADCPDSCCQGWDVVIDEETEDFYNSVEGALGKKLREAIYTDGDGEICLRAGYLADGRLLAAIFELGIDPLDTLTVFLENEPTRIEMMLPDGNTAPVAFEKSGDGLYTLDVRVETLYPLILFIK